MVARRQPDFTADFERTQGRDVSSSLRGRESAARPALVVASTVRRHIGARSRCGSEIGRLRADGAADGPGLRARGHPTMFRHWDASLTMIRTPRRSPRTRNTVRLRSAGRRVPSARSLHAVRLLASNDAGMSGVQIGPGATALTRIPLSISASDNERVCGGIVEQRFVP